MAIMNVLKQTTEQRTMSNKPRTDLHSFGNPFIAGDDWEFGQAIFADTDTFTDATWSGCDYRGETGSAFNVVITGRKSVDCGYGQDRFRTRIKIIAVGDDAADVSFGGYLFTNKPICAL